MPVDIDHGWYPFQDIALDRADVEWLLSTHESQGVVGPVDWREDETWDARRAGLDLRGADLREADLRHLPLARVRASLSPSESDRPSPEGTLTFQDAMDAAQAHFEGARLDGAHLEEAMFMEVNLEDASLKGAYLQRARLVRANLNRAQLTGAHLQHAALQEAHMERASLHNAELAYADLSGAYLVGVFTTIGSIPIDSHPDPINLEHVTLAQANLQKARLRGARLQSAELSGAHLEGADLVGAHLEGVSLQGAYLEGARLGALWAAKADLARTDLADAHLEFANLSHAQLVGASLRGAHLAGANLSDADLSGADLDGAHLARKTYAADDANYQRVRQVIPNFPRELSGARLIRAILDRRTQLNAAELTGVYLDQITVDNTNLTVVKWQGIAPLGDELEARRARDDDGERKTRKWRIEEFEAAVRANRVLAVTLRAQGMSEDADIFAYRAQVAQRAVLRLQRRPGRWLFSAFLDVLAGYGYQPLRSIIAYALVIAVFTVAYFVLGGAHGQALSWNEALVVSMTAFHGRGFFGSAFQPADPQAAVAAVEALIGLFIEIAFIATFTQRFFAR
jgi:uncharacterized protein YjbI with pentapeptide repeats